MQVSQQMPADSNDMCKVFMGASRLCCPKDQ